MSTSENMHIILVDFVTTVSFKSGTIFQWNFYIYMPCHAMPCYTICRRCVANLIIFIYERGFRIFIKHLNSLKWWNIFSFFLLFVFVSLRWDANVCVCVLSYSANLFWFLTFSFISTFACHNFHRGKVN